MKFIELGKIAEFINGYAFKPTDWSNTGVKIVRIQNLTSGEKSFNRTTKSVPDKYLIRKGDILVSWSATLDVFEWYEEENALLNQHIFLVKPFPDLIGKKYFKYALGYSIAEMSNFTHGSTMKHIVRKDFLKHKIPLPSIEKQQHIVKILDLAQSLIEKRKQAIAYLDDYIKAVFLDMFGDPVSNPKGIKTLKGGELFGFSSGKFNPTKNLSQEYSYPTYGGNGITGFSQKYLIDYPTIVIGRVGAYCGSIHKILSKSWVTDNAIFISKFKLKVNLDFLYYQFIFLNFNRFSDFSGQPKITQKPLESTNYLFPDLVDQNKFSKIVQKTESLKQIMQSQLKELENNFQAQLQRAFRGE
jgi:type I restriction enzyme S subunit